MEKHNSNIFSFDYQLTFDVYKKSIVCVVDTFQSSSFIATTSGDNHKSTSEVKYTSGKATMTLFNKLISLPIPKLEDGEKVT